MKLFEKVRTVNRSIGLHVSLLKHLLFSFFKYRINIQSNYNYRLTFEQ